MTEIELSDSCIEAVARRVVELLEQQPGAPCLVDAAELARSLGVTRDWVYRHATEAASGANVQTHIKSAAVDT
jgi:hypothetical protein